MPESLANIITHITQISLWVAAVVLAWILIRFVLRWTIRIFACSLAAVVIGGLLVLIVRNFI